MAYSYNRDARTIVRDDTSVWWSFTEDQPNSNWDIERALIEDWADIQSVDEPSNRMVLSAKRSPETRVVTLKTDDQREEVQAAIDATKAIFGWGDAKAIAYLKLMREFVRRVQ